MNNSEGRKAQHGGDPRGSGVGISRIEGERDAIVLENEFAFHGPDASGKCSATFYAFNTAVTLLAFDQTAARFANEPGAQTLITGAGGGGELCRTAFLAARDACRRYERLFSRTLPHSDIARLNAADGAWVDIAPETFDVLRASLGYCAESDGTFDITMGAAVQLWDFHRGIVPDETALREALSHVDWRRVELGDAGEHGAARNAGDASTQANAFSARARLADPHASVDIGGTAKGWIADALGEVLRVSGIKSYVVNLGGNVLAHGRKPDGHPWIVGLQDPRHRREEAPMAVLGAIELENASAVTSGTYERSFSRDGVTYHHILDPATGYPVRTDVAGVTVVARKSMDAEGYSTTLLALGRERGAAFVRAHPAIRAAYFIDGDGGITVAP